MGAPNSVVARVPRSPNPQQTDQTVHRHATVHLTGAQLPVVLTPTFACYMFLPVAAHAYCGRLLPNTYTQRSIAHRLSTALISRTARQLVIRVMAFGISAHALAFLQHNRRDVRQTLRPNWTAETKSTTCPACTSGSRRCDVCHPTTRSISHTHTHSAIETSEDMWSTPRPFHASLPEPDKDERLPCVHRQARNQ